ncbi:MAG: cyclic nucleotide-binding domain-containing protein [Pseudomonadota bacterium]
MSIIVLTGIVGVGLYLAAYALLQLGYLRGSGNAYTFLNMGAALCVLVSLLEEYSLASLLIQVSWITISIVGLTRRYIAGKNITFSEREKQIGGQIVPSLSGPDLRRFLNTGAWIDRSAGDRITDQGREVDFLYFLSEGEAEVQIDDVHVASIQKDSFIGEMTCLTGAPATATVVLASDSTCFRIPADRLRKFLAQNELIREQLERSFAADLRKKLNASAALMVDLHKKKVPV